MFIPKGDDEKNHYDYEIAAWERLTSACKLEKQWTNERLGRFFTAQGFLLAALAVSVVPKQSSIEISTLQVCLAVLICFIGLSTAISCFLTICAAVYMHWEWSKRLHKFTEDSTYIKEANQFTFGCCSRIPGSISRATPLVAPTVITFAWLMLLILIPVSSSKICTLLAPLFSK